MIAVALLAWRVGAASPRRAALLGFAFGTAWLCAGTWWLFVSMHRYGGLPAWLAALAVLGLAAFLSLYLAAAMALAARWRTRSPARAAMVFAAAGCSPNSRAASASPGFRGSRAATRTSTRRSPASRRGSASMASAPSRPALSARFGLADLRSARAWIAPRLRACAGRRRRCCCSAGSTSRRRRGTLTISLLQGNVPQQEKFEPAFCRRRSPRPPPRSQARAASSWSAPRP